ncbi:hypothetical protein BaRGS_00036622 [Batillaria attramentaria]|uniref:Uncharacterized protein n=1 Tax=Batillaria attramentaria TaxID=370345 RepID=A0ABD0JAY5_9CAEN
MEQKQQGHKGWFIGLFVLNFFVLLCLYFTAIAQPEFIEGIYKHSMENQSAKYYIQITPSGWTFSIWGFIYVWQALWAIYSLVLLCRKTPDGPAYLCPVTLTPAMFVCFMLANACSIAWSFFFDRDHIEAAFVAILGIPIFLVLAIALSYRALDAASPTLVAQGRSRDIWLVRGLVHNALAMYGTWTAIASLLNLAIVIHYRSDPVISNEDACTVALAVLSVEILVFYATDLLLLDRYSRYTITPYIVVVVAFIGSIDKNWVDGARNSIFSAVLLAVGGVGLLVKLILTVYRHVTRPRTQIQNDVIISQDRVRRPGYRGIFVSTPGNQSDKYYLEITPAGWTFSIWGFIYTWQALWVLYSIVNLFRTTAQGPAYVNPPVLPCSLFVLYSLTNCCNIAWLFLFDRDYIEGAFVALFFTAFSLILALAVTYRSLDWCSSQLVEQGRSVDIWLVRGLVHNGLGIYATWTSIATLLNMAMVITYSDGSDISVKTASTVALGVLTAEIVVFVGTDLFLLDRYSRYTITPYLVVVVALIGSISKNWESGATNSIFTAVLLAVGSLALLVKLVLTIYRHVTRPRYTSHVTSTLSKSQLP